jgi:chorismate synthase
MGFEASRRPGSEVHDPIEGRGASHAPGTALHAPGTALHAPGASHSPVPDPRGGFRRPTNNAGGLEGGITTGEPVVVKLAMKPIATLMSPLPTVDLTSGLPAKAVSERSDVTAVPAMGVIAEAVVALVLADAMLEKFGGDSLPEMRRNYEGYVAALGSRWASAPDVPDR